MAQADPSPGPSPTPDPEAAADADAPGDGIAPDADLAPDVLTTPETLAQGDEGLFISGIDISHHNGDIDFEKVRDAGYEFVFIKATQDNDFIDPMFVTNMARARRPGWPRAATTSSTTRSTARSRPTTSSTVSSWPAAIDDALPPVVDVECWAPIGSSIHAVSAARLRDFVARVYERTGRLPIIYTSVFMWREVVGNAEGFEDLPLWAACWGCDAPPSIAPGWDDWAFWQTGIDRVPGVGSLDGNFFSGGADDLDGPAPAPAAASRLARRPRPARRSSWTSAAATRRTCAPRPTARRGRAGAPSAARRGPCWAPRRASQTPHVQLRDGPARQSPVFIDSITLDQSGPQDVDARSGCARRPARWLDGDAAATRRRTRPAERRPGEAGASRCPSTSPGRPATPMAGLADARWRSPAAGAAGAARRPAQLSPEWWRRGAPRPRSARDRCDVTVIGRDGVGNTTSARAGASRRRRRPVAGDGTASSVEVEGDQVGVIARRGPDGGRAAVLIDGEPAGLIDLYAPWRGEPEVVYVADLRPAPATHLDRGRPGTSDPTSTGSSVAIDGFVTLASG